MANTHNYSHASTPTNVVDAICQVNATLRRVAFALEGLKQQNNSELELPLGEGN